MPSGNYSNQTESTGASWQHASAISEPASDWTRLQRSGVEAKEPDRQSATRRGGQSSRSRGGMDAAEEETQPRSRTAQRGATSRRGAQARRGAADRGQTARRSAVPESRTASARPALRSTHIEARVLGFSREAAEPRCRSAETPGSSCPRTRNRPGNLATAPPHAPK